MVTDDPDLSRLAKDISDGFYHGNLEFSKHGYWVEAKDLKVGDVFLGANGELSMLLVSERTSFSDGITVYNFAVDENHSYFVIARDDAFGQTCILVHNAKYTNEPTLPSREIAQGNGVRIEHYYRSGDHDPAHLHVVGGGAKVRIGAMGKPLFGDPALSPAQKTLIEKNLPQIRAAVNKIAKWLKWGFENGHFK